MLLQYLAAIPKPILEALLKYDPSKQRSYRIGPFDHDVAVRYKNHYPQFKKLVDNLHYYHGLGNAADYKLGYILYPIMRNRTLQISEGVGIKGYFLYLMQKNYEPEGDLLAAISKNVKDYNSQVWYDHLPCE